MKVIKVQDQLHAQLAAAAKANDRTIGAEIEALLAKDSPTQEIYSDYIKDLFKRVERLTVALEAAMSAKTQAPTPQAQARPPRKDYIAEVRKLEAARDDELLWNQDPDDQAEIRNRYQSLIQEQWDLHHQSKD